MAKNKKVVIDITAKDKTKAGTAAAQKSLKGFASAMGPLVSAAFGAAAIKAATDAYIKQEQALYQLEQRIKSTGGAAGKTIDELQGTAAALQQITIYGDEATMEMQALLLTFTQIKGDQFDAATIAVQNVAAAMGTDLKSAALQVGKALNDPAGQLSALSRSGIQFTKDQKAMIKQMNKVGDVAGAQTVILKELETQFGGASGAHGLGGALKQLGNTFGDTMEIIGSGGGGDGLVSLLKQVNLGIADFNDAIAGGELSGFNDSLGVMADGLEAIRDAINDIPDLPQWMKDMGGNISREILPFPFNAMAGYANATKGNMPSSVTFPIGDVKPERFDSTPEKPAKKQQASKITGDVEGSNFYGPGIWEIQAQAEADANSLSLEMQMEYNTEKFAVEIDHGYQMQDLWLSNIEGRIDAELRGTELIAANEVALKKAKEQTWQATSGAFMDITNAMYTAGGKQSKKMFELNKVAGVADATVNTFIAANKTWAQWGYPWGIPMVAAVVAGGLANVAAITSQSFGGGGASAAAGGTGGGVPSSPVITQPVQEETDNRSMAIEINVLGNVIDQDKFARELIPSITKAINDGAR